jgi:hypothetical protein
VMPYCPDNLICGPDARYSPASESVPEQR